MLAPMRWRCGAARAVVAVLGLAAGSSCGRRTATNVDVTGALRVRWTARLEWDGVGGRGGVGQVQRNYLVVGPLDTALTRHRVPCGGARERLAVHPVSPVFAWRCRAGEPWQAGWYVGLQDGVVTLRDCLPLGRGAAPTWNAARVSIDRDVASCVARVNGTHSAAVTAYRFIEREGGADALADALAGLVASEGHAPPEEEFRAAFARLDPPRRARVSAALRGAAMSPDCDQDRAVLASELLDLAADAALTDALVAHLARFWTPWLPADHPMGWDTLHGAAFQPTLQRLTARLAPHRPVPVGRISCPVTQIRVNGRVDQVAEARAAVLRAGVPCPPADTTPPRAP